MTSLITLATFFEIHEHDVAAFNRIMPKCKQDLSLNLVVHRTAACLQFQLLVSSFHEVTRSISSQSAGCMLFADTHFYTCVESCTVGIECLTQNHSAPC